MKILFALLLCAPLVLFAQSIDGKGTPETIEITEIGDSEIADELGILSYSGEKSKYKKGKLVRSFQWFDFEGEMGQQLRFRREFNSDYFLYDEMMIAIPEIAGEEIRVSVQHSGKDIAIIDSPDDGNYYVNDGISKVYDKGVLRATIHFRKGRPELIYINHYYENGQLQFVREIKSEGAGKPLRNTGVLEAYYPDGSVFESPISEDGTAIILIDDNGEEYDQCQCMGQDIMEWGRGFLYSFIGKYVFLLEQLYQKEELKCCWE